MNAGNEQHEPRTAAALAARRSHTQAALDRVNDAIIRLRKEKAPVSVAAVARRAGVSRTFLYTNVDARTAITQASSSSQQRGAAAGASGDEQRDTPWRERALNAEEALKTANGEILNQRDRIGELLGRIRDIEAQWTQDAIQRVTSENTSLKQRLQQLTADNRVLDERLHAARSNLRFQDRRVADLEAQLASPEQLGNGSAGAHPRHTERHAESL